MPAPTGWGIPSPGDRSARDTHTYAHLHASDIEEEEHQVHVPVPAAPDLGAVALVRLVGSVYQWVKTHLSGAITVDADGVVSIDSGEATDGQVLTADGAGAAAWEDLPALADHDHSGDAGDGGTFDAANLESGVATDGQVLTADGDGGATWEDPAGAAAGTYRQFTYIPDGAGSWAFVVDGDGMPLFANLDVEE